MHLVTKYLPSSTRPNTLWALHRLYWLFYISLCQQEYEALQVRVIQTSYTAFRQARARQKVVLVFSLRSTSKVLQSLQTETCVQISKHLLLALQRTKPQLHLPLLHPPRASFSQEQRLILLVGWPKLGGTYRSCIVRKCCSVLSYTARRAGLSDTRRGESGKENVASEKECWGLLHH